MNKITNLVIAICILSFANCSGGSSSDEEAGGQTVIDISKYVFPSSSRTLTYDSYRCIDDSCDKEFSDDSVWIVEGSNYRLPGGGTTIFGIDGNDFDVNADDISATFVYGGDIPDEVGEFERFVTIETDLNPLDTETVFVLGPFASREITAGGQTITEEDVIVRLVYSDTAKSAFI